MSSARHDGGRGILVLGDTMRNLGKAAILAALMAGAATVARAQDVRLDRREIRDRVEDRRDRREDRRDRRTP